MRADQVFNIDKKCCIKTGCSWGDHKEVQRSNNSVRARDVFPPCHEIGKYSTSQKQLRSIADYLIVAIEFAEGD